jgi:hypothetical protein
MLRIKQMIHRPLARYRLLNHLIASEPLAMVRAQGAIVGWTATVDQLLAALP